MLPASLAADVPEFIATPDIGLRQGRRVVGAVTGHGDEPTTLLLASDERDLVLGRRLRQEVVDPCLIGDRLCGQAGCRR